MTGPKFVVSFYPGFRDTYGADVYAHGEGATIEEATKNMREVAASVVADLRERTAEAARAIESLGQL